MPSRRAVPVLPWPRFRLERTLADTAGASRLRLARSGRRPRRPLVLGGGGHGPSLVWRVFLANAVVLVGDGVVLATAAPLPGPAPVLAASAGLGLMLALNWLLLRRAVAPLNRLVGVVRDIEALSAGHVPTQGEVREVHELGEAFNGVLAQLAAEQRQAAVAGTAAQKEERKRISRELHDDIGQTLTGLLLWFRRAECSELGRLALEEPRAATRASLESIRRLAAELRAAPLDDVGLSRALSDLTVRMSRLSGVPIAGQLPPDLPDFDCEVEQAVYRVAQEGLTNAVRHADASHVELTVEEAEGTLVLTIRDDGRGVAGASSGQGLASMHERASLADGRLTVAERQEGGTELMLAMPT